ncbi:trace amine-associated receptor 1-like [Ylistrum balloti]|uniref:trace amine-associated receptor 1-like n=1 Tax=Ylistrum balloti TaxID=509963 RepID=UPI0029058345|nr:trace amine-associated receptor 1-like [Ylistrum balloti]
MNEDKINCCIIGMAESPDSTTSKCNISIPKDIVSEHMGYTFSDDPTRYVKIFFVALISVMIIMTNCLNICIVSKTKQLPRITRICFLNMSCSDLLVGLVSCFPCIVVVAVGEWPYGPVWCQIAGIMHGSSVTISIWSLSLVSIDRYLAIKKPLRYRSLLTVKRTYIIVFCLWVVALATFFLPLPTKDSFLYYQFSQEEMICGLYWEYKWFCVVTAVYIPVLSGTILIFTNVSVMRKVISVARRNSHQSKNYSAARTNDIKAVKLLIVTSTIYFIVWGPYVLEVVSISLFDITTIPPSVKFTTMWLANSNSFTNVFVYSFMYKSFRERVKLLAYPLLPCSINRQQPDSPDRTEQIQLSQYD